LVTLLDERSVANLGECLLDLALGVHHDRAIPGNRLLDRLADAGRPTKTGLSKNAAITLAEVGVDKKLATKRRNSRRCRAAHLSLWLSARRGSLADRIERSKEHVFY
jgi:hypothetical protein